MELRREAPTIRTERPLRSTRAVESFGRDRACGAKGLLRVLLGVPCGPPDHSGVVGPRVDHQEIAGPSGRRLLVRARGAPLAEVHAELELAERIFLDAFESRREDVPVVRDLDLFAWLSSEVLLRVKDLLAGRGGRRCALFTAGHPPRPCTAATNCSPRR